MPPEKKKKNNAKKSGSRKLMIKTDMIAGEVVACQTLTTRNFLLFIKLAIYRVKLGQTRDLFAIVSSDLLSILRALRELMITLKSPTFDDS